MDFGNNKFNATVSTNLNQENIKNAIKEIHKITGTNNIPLILLNPVNYEFVKESLDNICGIYNIVKSPYVEENTITVITDPYSQNEILGYCGCKKLFDE